MTSLSSLCLFFLIFASSLYSQIHVIMTSAVIPHQYEWRKMEYLTGFNAIKSYGFNPWIIEATKVTSTFYDEISNQVLYPQTNDLSLRNKGVNETMSMRASLPYLPFEDDDIVIKLTGRYHLYSREFIHIIEANANDYDAFVCWGKHFVTRGHVFTGCFAMRWKYFKKIISEMNLENAERQMIPVEYLFAEFIRQNNLKTKEIDPLHVRARIFYSGEGVEVLDF